MRRLILYGAVLVFFALPLFAEISFADERQIALWILRRGGQIMVDGVESPIGDPFDLPLAEGEAGPAPSGGQTQSGQRSTLEESAAAAQHNPKKVV